jgi:hypothetical protein
LTGMETKPNEIVPDPVDLAAMESALANSVDALLQQWGHNR